MFKPYIPGGHRPKIIFTFQIEVYFAYMYMKVEDDPGPINSLKAKGRQFQAERPIKKRV